MEGEFNYPDLNKLLADDEFSDMADKVGAMPRRAPIALSLTECPLP